MVSLRPRLQAIYCELIKTDLGADKVLLRAEAILYAIARVSTVSVRRYLPISLQGALSNATDNVNFSLCTNYVQLLRLLCSLYIFHLKELEHGSVMLSNKIPIYMDFPGYPPVAFELCWIDENWKFRIGNRRISFVEICLLFGERSHHWIVRTEHGIILRK